MIDSIFLVIHHRLAVVDKKKKVIIFVSFEWLILPKLLTKLYQSVSFIIYALMYRENIDAIPIAMQFAKNRDIV